MSVRWILGGLKKLVCKIYATGSFARQLDGGHPRTARTDGQDLVQ